MDTNNLTTLSNSATSSSGTTVQTNDMNIDKENATEKLRNIFDEKASTTAYTTRLEIIKAYEGENYNKKQSYSKLNSYSLLRKLMLSSVLTGKLEYKNKKKFFRYKQEYRHFFKYQKELNEWKHLTNNDKRLAQIQGLEMIFDNHVLSNPLIDLECITDLKNIRLIKELLKYLQRRVITFSYNRAYEYTEKITMSPHLLKEYNSRWFLFGFVHKEDKYELTNFSIDRIIEKKKVNTFIVEESIPFKASYEGLYENYFKDIVGVTKEEHQIAQKIVFKTTQFKVHKLIQTKPIHPSQMEIEPFDMEKQEGRFSIHIIPNIELQTRLLSFGPGIVIEGEGEFEKNYRESIKKMAAELTKSGY